jgi:hypothetical protein
VRIVQKTAEGNIQISSEPKLLVHVSVLPCECGQCPEHLHVECDRRVNGGEWANTWACTQNTLLCCQSNRTDEVNWEDVRFRWFLPDGPLACDLQIRELFRFFNPSFVFTDLPAKQAVIPAGQVYSAVQYIDAPDEAGRIQLQGFICCPLCNKPTHIAGGVTVTSQPEDDDTGCNVSYTWSFDQDLNITSGDTLCHRNILVALDFGCEEDCGSVCHLVGEALLTLDQDTLLWNAYFNVSVSNESLVIVAGIVADFDFAFAGTQSISASFSEPESVGSASIGVAIT